MSPYAQTKAPSYGVISVGSRGLRAELADCVCAHLVEELIQQPGIAWLLYRTSVS